jgi:hypothetical protein
VTHSSCNLAVNETAAYCSYGKSIEKRDLVGGNPTMFLDQAKSKTTADFGALSNYQGALIIRSSIPDEKTKHVIRAVNPNSDEKLVACGRTMVTDLSVDATHVAWIEQNVGVFLAAR